MTAEITVHMNQFRNGIADRALTVVLTKQGLTIFIDPEMMKSATEECPDLWSTENDRYTVTVTDPMQWLNSVMQKMIEMKEDGRTLLTDMIDRAIVKAVEDGEEGCDV